MAHLVPDIACAPISRLRHLSVPSSVSTGSLPLKQHVVSVTRNRTQSPEAPTEQGSVHLNLGSCLRASAIQTRAGQPSTRKETPKRSRSKRHMRKEARSGTRASKHPPGKLPETRLPQQGFGVRDPPNWPFCDFGIRCWRSRFSKLPCGNSAEILALVVVFTQPLCAVGFGRSSACP